MELRRFNVMQRGAIPCYANAPTWETLRQTFSYIFDGVTRLGGGIPELDPQEIAGPFTLRGVRDCHENRARRTRNVRNASKKRGKESAIRADSRKSFCAIVTTFAHDDTTTAGKWPSWG